MDWRKTALALAAIGAIGGGAARAAEPADRFTLQPAEGGFLRLDRENGATSFCSPAPEGYSCRATAEGPAPAGDAVARLEKRIAALEEQVKALTQPQPELPAVPPLPKDGDDKSLGLPTEEQIDRVTSFLERAMRRLKNLAEELGKQDEAPPKGERL